MAASHAVEMLGGREREKASFLFSDGLLLLARPVSEK